MMTLWQKHSCTVVEIVLKETAHHNLLMFILMYRMIAFNKLSLCNSLKSIITYHANLNPKTHAGIGYKLHCMTYAVRLSKGTYNYLQANNDPAQ